MSLQCIELTSILVRHRRRTASPAPQAEAQWRLHPSILDQEPMCLLITKSACEVSYTRCTECSEALVNPSDVQISSVSIYNQYTKKLYSLVCLYKRLFKLMSGIYQVYADRRRQTHTVYCPFGVVNSHDLLLPTIHSPSFVARARALNTRPTSRSGRGLVI